jgi:hypothetical protein
MNETRRFLRYVMPGIVGVAVFLVMDYISARQFMPPRVLNGSWVVSFAGAAVIIAGLGYLASHLHHLLLWCVYSRLPRLRMHLDHGGTLQRARNEGFLELQPNVHLSPQHATTPHKAWIILTAAWNSHKEGNALAKAHGRADSLGDLYHGSGATMVSSFFAVIGWSIGFLVPERVSVSASLGGTVGALVFGLLVTVATAISTHKLAHTTSQVVNIIFESFCWDFKQKTGKPLTLYIGSLNE